MLRAYILTEKQLDDNGYPSVYKKCENNEVLAYLPKSTSQQQTAVSKYSIQNHTITSAKYNSSCKEEFKEF
jgi:hypothetical protein